MVRGVMERRGMSSVAWATAAANMELARIPGSFMALCTGRYLLGLPPISLQSMPDVSRSLIAALKRQFPARRPTTCDTAARRERREAAGGNKPPQAAQWEQARGQRTSINNATRDKQSCVGDEQRYEGARSTHACVPSDVPATPRSENQKPLAWLHASCLPCLRATFGPLYSRCCML